MNIVWYLNRQTSPRLRGISFFVAIATECVEPNLMFQVVDAQTTILKRPANLFSRNKEITTIGIFPTFPKKTAAPFINSMACPFGKVESHP